jgi:hypothetical protein
LGSRAYVHPYAGPLLSAADFVPLPVDKFQRAFAAALHAMDGTLRVDSRSFIEPKDGSPQARAWFLAGLLFADLDERASFHWRIGNVLPLLQDRKYRKYQDPESLVLHIALLRTLCVVGGSARTTKRTLRMAFDTEFKRQLADVASNGGSTAQ